MNLKKKKEKKEMVNLQMIARTKKNLNFVKLQVPNSEWNKAKETK